MLTDRRRFEAYPEAPAGDIPRFDTDQMIEVDRAMMEDCRIELTLALPKTGLFAPDVPDRAGELFLADIGVPPDL